MHDRGTELEAAKRAKQALLALTSDWPELAGVGITEADGSYAVKVNLSRDLSPERARVLPAELGGVRIVTAVTGRVRPL